MPGVCEFGKCKYIYMSFQSSFSLNCPFIKCISFYTQWPCICGQQDRCDHRDIRSISACCVDLTSVELLLKIGPAAPSEFTVPLTLMLSSAVSDIITYIVWDQEHENKSLWFFILREHVLDKDSRKWGGISAWIYMCSEMARSGMKCENRNIIIISSPQLIHPMISLFSPAKVWE